MNRLLVLVSVFLLASALSCTDGEDDPISGQEPDLTGVIFLVADGFSPPTTFACNAGHSGMSNAPLCSSFDLDLQPEGGGYIGTSTQNYCGAEFSAVVSVNGSDLSGQIVADDGSEVIRFTFTGSTTGSTAIIEPGSFSVDGLSGNCTTSGFYNAVF